MFNHAGETVCLLDLAVVGHLTIDSIILPGHESPYVVLGGSAAYSSIAARRLDSRVAIVSRVGADFPKAYMWWLQQEGIELSNVITDDHAQTTRFDLKYDDDLVGRVLRRKSVAPPLLVDDLPTSLKAKAVHVAPLAGELQFEAVERLRGQAEILSLDPQGLVRDFAPDGTVNIASLADKRILSLIDICNCSEAELAAVTGSPSIDSAIRALHDCGVSIVIVNSGAKGSTVSVEGDVHEVPVSVPEKVVDPTGAGDAFIGSFLAAYVQGEDCCWCSCVASAAASFVVEGVGPTAFGDKEAVYGRARVLYEKEIKQ